MAFTQCTVRRSCGTHSIWMGDTGRSSTKKTDWNFSGGDDNSPGSGPSGPSGNGECDSNQVLMPQIPPLRGAKRRLHRAAGDQQSSIVDMSQRSGKSFNQEYPCLTLSMQTLLKEAITESTLMIGKLIQ
jgi:hypothetical protein